MIAHTLSEMSACFQGEACEFCAPGYTRQIKNGGRLVECVPCDCNGHDANNSSCHSESAVCNCSDHTYGDTCDLCLPEYFGQATDGTPGLY